jgi:hypothetical protein
MDYSVELPHFYELRYIEGDRSMSIAIDLRDRVPLLCRSEIRRWDPPSEDRRTQILRRVHSYLTGTRGFKVEIESAGELNRTVLRDRLLREGVPAGSYSLDGGHPNEAHVLAHEGTSWLVYYSERGLETARQSFATKSEACRELLARLLRERRQTNPDPHGYHELSRILGNVEAELRDVLATREAEAVAAAAGTFPFSSASEYLGEARIALRGVLASDARLSETTRKLIERTIERIDEGFRRVGGG